MIKRHRKDGKIPFKNTEFVYGRKIRLKRGLEIYFSARGIFVVIGLSSHHRNQCFVWLWSTMSLIAWLWKITVLDPGISRSSLGFVASWGLVTLQEFSIQHNLHRKCLFSVWKLRQVETKVSKECRIFQCILCLLAQVKPLLLSFCPLCPFHYMKEWPNTRENSCF